MRKLLFLPLLILAGCASRQAGVMIGKAQGEITQFSAQANIKIKLGEDRRLELELKELQTKADFDHASPALIIKRTQELIAAHDLRLAEWLKNSSLIQNAAIELAGAANYNSNGLTAADAIAVLGPIVDQLIAIYTKPATLAATPTP